MKVNQQLNVCYRCGSVSYLDSRTELVIDPLCQLKWRQTRPNGGSALQMKCSQSSWQLVGINCALTGGDFCLAAAECVLIQKKNGARVALRFVYFWKYWYRLKRSSSFFFRRRWTMTSRPEMRAKGAGSNFWTFRKKYLCCAQRQRLLAIVERYRSGHTATDFHIIIKCPSVAIRRSAGPPGPKIVAGNFSTSLTFSVEEKIH